MSNVIDIVMPPLQEGTESVVASWLRKPGEAVRQHEPIVEINTDKAITEVAAPASGVLLEILKHPDQMVNTGEILGRIEVGATAAAAPAAASPSSPAVVSEKHVEATAGVHDLSPAVRALVKQHNLDVSRIPGTGRGGRITHEDVQNYLREREAAPQPAKGAAGPLAGRMISHSPMRKRIAAHMVQSALQTAPHVTAVFEADLSAIVAHRQRHLADFERRGVRLTFTAYFVAATVLGIKRVPEVNSRWHDDALEVFDSCNIGIAAAVNDGLVVPVLHGAEQLDLFGIAQRLQTMTDRARQGKLTLEEMQGGTFTITNHGVSGSLIATPIINQPQSAILGIGKMEKRLSVIEHDGIDSIQIRPKAYVTITIDHRVLDGFKANTFLGTFVEALNGFEY